MTRNPEVWLDIYDLPVFEDANEIGTSAWTWAEKLEKSGRLTQVDLIVLKALLEVCINYGKENPES